MPVQVARVADYDRPMIEPAHLAEVAQLPSRRSPVRAALVALRPRQWLKNLLLFAGIIFAAQLGDPARALPIW